MDLKQWSRIRWVVYGDENSRFFHGYVNNRRSKNRIHGLIIDGSWTTEADAIKLEAFNFFQGNSRSGGHQGQKLLVTVLASFLRVLVLKLKNRSQQMKSKGLYGRAMEIKHPDRMGSHSVLLKNIGVYYTKIS